MNDSLRQMIEEDIMSFYEKGYAWLKKSLLPELEQYSKATVVDNVLLADIWCLLGDVHDLNGAPLQAMEYYKKSISIHPNNPAPYREMAALMSQVGRYFEAFQFINLAIEKDPDHEELVGEKQKYQDDMNYDLEPVLTEEDEIWKLSELLAQEQFEKVIEDVLNKKMNDIDLLKCLNQAYGGLEKTDLYLKTWQKMKDLDDDIELDYADWFYMPRRIYKSKEMATLRATSPLWEELEELD